VWVAVAEDPINGGGGLARYDTTLGSFINPPYTVDNGGITSHTIFDMDIYGDIIALASNIGARVIGFLEAPSFSNIALNSGLPPAAGSSHIQSLALTSSYLYLSLKPTPDERQPYGALARFTHDVEGQNPIDFTSAQLYASADTDVLTVPEADLVSTRLHDLTSPNDYVQLSYSSCGSEAYPGLVGLLDGEAGLYQRVEETRLKTSGDTNVLIPSPGEHLTWAQSYQGEGDIKVYLTDLADEYPDPYQLRDPLPRRAVQALNRAVKMCQRYELTGNPGQYSVECLLEENYYASNLNESWNVNPNPLFDGIPTDIRSFIVDGDKPATVRWYATDRGLIRRTNNTVFDEGYVIPGYGVGAPEITNLYAVHHSLFHNLLFVGSDQGVHYSPTANGGVTQQLWTPIDALKGVKVYGIAEGPAGALWVASARGLVKVTLAEGLVSEVSYYGAEQGLPTGKVERVAVSAEGYVFALHQSGLSLYRDGVWTHYGPRRGATQGATQLMLTEGYAWVGGPHGVTRFSY